MKNYFLIIIATTLALSVLGCRHRAVATNTYTGQQQNMTMLHAGDKAEYSLNGNTQISLGANSLSQIQGTGHKTVTVVAGTNHGRAVPSYVVETFDIQSDNQEQAKGRSKSWTDVIWIGKDVSGNLYLLGESPDGAKWDVVTDTNAPLYMPSKLSVGYSWGYIAHFASGSTESLDMKCVGMEKLSTPVGEYNAYKVSETGTHTRLRVNLSGYIWLTSSQPFIFELKGQISSTIPMLGVQANHSSDYTLESISLAR